LEQRVKELEEEDSKRKRAEEALQKSEEKYRILIESLQEGVWVIDKDNMTTFVNIPMADMLGYTVEEMLGRHLFSFMDEKGVNITERKQAEDALRKSKDSLRLAGQIAQVGYWSRDLQLDEITWSGETCRIFGLEPQTMQFSLTALPDYVHPEDNQMVLRAIQDAVKGIRPYDVEYRVQRPDGTVRWVHSKGEVNLDKNGQSGRMFGMVLDITERKRVEADLAKQLKELRRWYHATLGWESYILELKHEVNELPGYLSINLLRMEESQQRFCMLATDLTEQKSPMRSSPPKNYHKGCWPRPTSHAGRC
jgi:PAS domain S-box-containing protein